jgi:hypothetical protein
VTRRPIHPAVDATAVQELWEEWGREPEVEESVDEILDRNYYDTISGYDPHARLPRWLRMRIRGSHLPPGQLDTVAVQDLLRAFHAELRGASPHGSGGPPVVRLTGFSSGSTVLHLAPALPESSADEGQMAIVVDRLDALMGTVTDLHNTAETAGDLRRFADHESLLKGLHEMVLALDRHNLELDLTWRNAEGQHRTSHLTRQAREYVRSQWEDQEESEIVQLAGRLSAIDLKGTFTLKRTARPSATYRIDVGDESTLLGLNLELGSTYSVQAQRVVRRNRAGLEFSPTHRLLRILPSDERLT